MKTGDKQALDDLLRRREIKKKVDPGLSDFPLPSTSRPSSVQPQIPRTGGNTLVRDMLDYAAQAEREVQEAIQVIEDRNTEDPVFVQYAQIVRDQAVTPEQVVAGTAPQEYPYAVVRLLERDLYENSPDPAAPMMRDMQRILYNIRTVRYVLDKLWSKVFKPNKLYGSPREKRLAKWALVMEQNYLKQMSYWAWQMANLQAPPLSDAFSVALSESLALVEDDQSRDRLDLDQLLSAAEMLMHDSLTDMLSTFESFQDVLDQFGGNPESVLQAKLASVVPYAVMAGITNPIMNLLNTMDSLPESAEIEDVREFRDQLVYGLQIHLKRAEDDMVVRQATEEHDSRELMMGNVLRASLIKQYRYCLQRLRAGGAQQASGNQTESDRIQRRVTLGQDIQSAVKSFRNVLRLGDQTSQSVREQLQSLGSVLGVKL